MSLLSDCQKSRQTAEIFPLPRLVSFFGFYLYEMCLFFKKRFVSPLLPISSSTVPSYAYKLKIDKSAFLFRHLLACRRFIDTLKSSDNVTAFILSKKSQISLQVFLSFINQVIKAQKRVAQGAYIVDKPTFHRLFTEKHRSDIVCDFVSCEHKPFILLKADF